MGAAAERFVEALSAGYRVRANGQGRWRAQCPAHGGEDLNLCIADGNQGVLLKCQSYDCPAEDVASAVGLTLSDLFDKDGRAVYDYGNGHRVTRRNTRDGKRIYQENKPATTTLYRHPDSEPLESPSGFVVLVEGEKCVDAALRLGAKCVTTWPGGASGVDNVDLGPLSGQHVQIVADNDEPGRQAAARLSSRLAGIATVDAVWTAPNDHESVDDIYLSGGSLTDLVSIQVEPKPDPRRPREPSVTGLSTISSKRTRFLWDRMIPQSAVSLFAGMGGVAKSTFAIWLSGQLNQGVLPGELFGSKSPVLYVSHEDSPEEVVAPRADANGVTRELFHLLSIDSIEVGGLTTPALPDDMPLIREAVEKTGAKLIIIDPITSTLNGGDNDKMADVRRVMDPLNQFAAETGVSVIGIAHFRKGAGSQSQMISGSHAWRDSARCVALFARDEEEDVTILTLDKINSGAAGQSFKYRLDIVDQLTDEGTTTEVGHIVWEGTSEQSVGDMINKDHAKGRQGKLANELVEHIESFAPRALKTSQLSAAFPEENANTITKNLKRLASRGLIENPGHGIYQAASKVAEAPPASANRTSCSECGDPLPDFMVAEGSTTHPSCDNR